MKLQTLKIKDEIQGRLSKSTQYLARSVDHENKKLDSDISERGITTTILEDEDSFADALQDFMSVSDQGLHSPNTDLIGDLSSSHLLEQHDAGGYADTSNHGMEQMKGKIGEVFYEAADSNIPDFVSVTFLTRNPGSPQYVGIDTQVKTSFLRSKFTLIIMTFVVYVGIFLTHARARTR